MQLEDADLSTFLRALKFAAEKHRKQRRKDQETPYINHPIEVAQTLWATGEVRDIDVLAAAVLHDTIEDTDTSPEEIERLFGAKICSLVQEVTDDKSLPKQKRKELQIETAGHKSNGAKQIKLADKISNVTDIANTPPPDWSQQRRLEYLLWSEKVVAGLRGANRKLEDAYDQALRNARSKLE